jgi:hypothetical protein
LVWDKKEKKDDFLFSKLSQSFPNRQLLIFGLFNDRSENTTSLSPKIQKYLS